MKKVTACLLACLLLLSVSYPAAADSKLYYRTVPERYLDECPEHGEVHSHLYKGEKELLVWTPFRYDENKAYYTILLLSGDGGDQNDWIKKPHYLYNRSIMCRNLYDWIAYDDLCEPFIVVSIANNPDLEELCEDILDAFVFTSQNYHTFAQTPTREGIRENRDGFILGGLSRGSINTLYFMIDHADLIGNYILMSGSDKLYREALEEHLKQKPIPIGKIYMAIGKDDELYRYLHYVLYRMLVLYVDDVRMEEFAYGHIWHTWFNGVYDALLYMIPKEPPIRKVLKRVQERIAQCVQNTEP